MDRENLKVLVACETSGTVRDAFFWEGFDAWSCDILDADTPTNRHLKGDVLDVIGWDEWDLVMIGHPPCTRLCSSGNWKISGSEFYFHCSDCGTVNAEKAVKKRGGTCKCGSSDLIRTRNEISPITGIYQPKEMVEGVLSQGELQQLWDDFEQAVELFKALQAADVPMIAIENPKMATLAKQHIWGKKWEQLWKDDGQFRQTSVQPFHFADGLDSPDNYSKETYLWLKNLPALRPTGDPSLTIKTARKDIHNATPSADRWKVRSKFPAGISQAMAEQWGSAALQFKQSQTQSIAA